MLVISAPGVPAGASELAGKERDTLALTWEERRWTRKRVHTSGGREIALALPTGTVLHPGDVLAVGDDWYLAVEGRVEPVLAVTPRDRDEAVRLAFDVGNRHFPLAFDGTVILLPDDTAMEQLLTRLGATWQRRHAVFEPLGRGHEPAWSHRHPALAAEVVGRNG